MISDWFKAALHEWWHRLLNVLDSLVWNLIFLGSDSLLWYSAIPQQWMNGHLFWCRLISNQCGTIITTNVFKIINFMFYFKEPKEDSQLRNCSVDRTVVSEQLYFFIDKYVFLNMHVQTWTFIPVLLYSLLAKTVIPPGLRKAVRLIGTSGNLSFGGGIQALSAVCVDCSTVLSSRLTVTDSTLFAQASLLFYICRSLYMLL